MIRKLTQKDAEEATALLTQAPAWNLYLLGNMEKLGFDQPICEFWGEFDEAARLRAVLNRYMTGWSLYGLPETRWAAITAVLDDHPMPATRLQDNPGGTESVLPYLRRYRAEQVHTETLMDLDAAAFQPIAPGAGVHVRRADLADLPALANFYADAEHMTRSPMGVERPLRDTRVWVAEAEAQICAAALTNAETATLAMVGGVYTPPARRGQGLSQAVCSALCADLLADGKRPVLYWDTPAAGSVYRKLGFRHQGSWRSVWLARVEPG